MFVTCPFCFRTDGSLFNLICLQAYTKTKEKVITNCYLLMTLPSLLTPNQPCSELCLASRRWAALGLEVSLSRVLVSYGNFHQADDTRWPLLRRIFIKKIVHTTFSVHCQLWVTIFCNSIVTAYHENSLYWIGMTVHSRSPFVVQGAYCICHYTVLCLTQCAEVSVLWLHSGRVVVTLLMWPVVYLCMWWKYDVILCLFSVRTVYVTQQTITLLYCIVCRLCWRCSSSVECARRLTGRDTYIRGQQPAAWTTMMGLNQRNPVSACFDHEE